MRESAASNLTAHSCSAWFNSQQWKFRFPQNPFLCGLPRTLRYHQSVQTLTGLNCVHDEKLIMTSHDGWNFLCCSWRILLSPFSQRLRNADHRHKCLSPCQAIHQEWQAQMDPLPFDIRVHLYIGKVLGTRKPLKTLSSCRLARGAPAWPCNKFDWEKP